MEAASGLVVRGDDVGFSGDALLNISDLVSPTLRVEVVPRPWELDAPETVVLGGVTFAAQALPVAAVVLCIGVLIFLSTVNVSS